MKKLSVTTMVVTAGAMGFLAFGETIAANAAAPTVVAQATSDAAVFAALMADGGPLFAHNCSGCHGAQGQGLVGPKLDGNDFVAVSGHIISQILQGNASHGMPPFLGQLNAHQIAAIATYVRNSWSNSYGVTTEATVMQYLPQ